MSIGGLLADNGASKQTNQTFNISLKDAYVASFGVNGDYYWSYIFEMEDYGGECKVQAINYDMNSNVYVAGSFTGDLLFNGVIYNAPTLSAFVAQFDAFGTPLYFSVIGQVVNPGVDDFKAFDIAVDDASGDYYVSAAFDGDWNFGGTSVTSTMIGARRDGALLHISPLGLLAHGEFFVSGGQNYVQDLEMAGQSVLANHHQMNIYPLTVGPENLNTYNGDVLFKYTVADNIPWAKCGYNIQSTNAQDLNATHYPSGSYTLFPGGGRPLLYDGTGVVWGSNKIMDTNGDLYAEMDQLFYDKIGQNGDSIFLYDFPNIYPLEITQYEAPFFVSTRFPIAVNFCGKTEHHCAGDTITEGFKILIESRAQDYIGQTIYAQLSDANGLFTSPTIIGQRTITFAQGNITCVIPAGTAAGSNYRIRMVTSGGFVAQLKPTQIIIHRPARVSLISGGPVLCGSSITLSVPATMPTPIWDNNHVTQTGSSVSVTAPGVVSVRTKDQYGCAAFDTMQIYPSGPEICNNGIDDNCDGIIDNCCPNDIVISGDTTLCNEQFAELHAFIPGFEPATYEWMTLSDGSIVTDSVFYISYAEDIRLTLTTLSGCTLQRSIHVLKSANMYYDIAGNNLCAGATAGDFDITVQGGTPPYQYLWVNNLTGATDNLEDHYSVPVAEGFSGTITDAGGCSITAYENFNVNQPIDIQISGDTLPCGASSGTITVSASGGSPFYDALGNAYYIGAGSYLRSTGAQSASVRDALGCIATRTYTVAAICTCNLPAVPISAQGQSVMAHGSAVYCYANPIKLVAGNVSGATYNWSAPSGRLYTGRIVNVQSADTTYSGRYTVYVTRGNCSTTSYIDVVVRPKVYAYTTSAQTVCPGSTVYLIAYSNLSSVSYQWRKNSTVLSNNASYFFTANSSTNGTYQVRVTDAYQCTASASTSVSMFQPATITPSVSFSNSNTRFKLNVNGSTLTASNATYTWTGPAGFTSSAKQTANITAVAAHYGTYTIRVVTAQGCILQSTINVAAPVLKTDETEEILTQETDFDWALYPNPTSRSVTIKTDKGVTDIEVQNMLGEVVLKLNDPADSIDLTELANGMYMMVVQFGDKTRSAKKFIKE